MALFKIFKGNNSNNLLKPTINGVTNQNYKTPIDGYAYYDTSTKLFYIDADYTGDGTISRAPINAAHAGVAGNALNGIFYGVCDSSQSAQAKVATLTDATGFTLVAGTTIVIKFTNASANSLMTLALYNNNGNNISPAKNLMLYGTTGINTSGWEAGSIISFVYDGTNWIGVGQSNTTVKVVRLI